LIRGSLSSPWSRSDYCSLSLDGRETGGYWTIFNIGVPFWVWIPKSRPSFLFLNFFLYGSSKLAVAGSSLPPLLDIRYYALCSFPPTFSCVARQRILALDIRNPTLSKIVLPTSFDPHPARLRTNSILLRFDTIPEHRRFSFLALTSFCVPSMTKVCMDCRIGGLPDLPACCLESTP